MENVPTLTFLFMDLADLPPSHSYYIRYVFLSSDVFLNVFLSYGPSLLKILYLQPQPTYQLMNFQITVKDALHPSLCMKEHM